jgi:hypothetical protein
MATPAQYDIPSLQDRGNKWFAAQTANTPEAILARAALEKRGYFGKKDAKGKVLIPDHNAEGLALFKTFQDSSSSRAKTRPGRVGKASAEEAAAVQLRIWVRDNHAELVGIKRNVTDSGLEALPTLDELETASGLRHSAQQVIAFLSTPELQPVLGKYAMSSADGMEGQALLQAWDATRTDLNLTRGGEKNVTQQNSKSSLLPILTPLLT